MASKTNRPLEAVGIRHAPLSDRIVLARFGKDPEVALETRDAMGELIVALLSYAFSGKVPTQGTTAKLVFEGGDDEKYTLSLTREEVARGTPDETD